ncbi:MAG: hypothetical protein IPL79_08450 [Myxococcales bacterium]|nr:hypothetical protein [Myxococcales bacterium]
MSRFVRRITELRPLDASPMPEALAAAVVIPCCDEPDLPATLKALLACELSPGVAVEILVVVNESTDAPPAVVAQNLATMGELEALREELAVRAGAWRLFAIHAPALPPKQAGVGMARRLGMDEAARRFLLAGRPRGVICSLDADALVTPNYIAEVLRHFATHPALDAVSIYFEHPLGGALRPEHDDAIIDYELHLRYWVQGLRWAGCPWAFQTVGSAFAVRAMAYIEQGGMSERQAGEDFYFLHKFSVRGVLGDLTTTTVYPSPRVSTRTPFGTGQAVAQAVAGQGTATYAWSTLQEIAALIGVLPRLRADAEAWRGLAGPLTTFLADHDFAAVVAEAARQTSSPAAMTRRLLQWFTPFRAMKYAHAARAGGAFDMPPRAGAHALLTAMGQAPAADARGLLTQLRSLAKAGRGS